MSMPSGHKAESQNMYTKSQLCLKMFYPLLERNLTPKTLCDAAY